MSGSRGRVEHVCGIQAHRTGGRVHIRANPQASIAEICIDLAVTDSQPTLQGVFRRDPNNCLASARRTFVDESISDVRRVAIAVVINDGYELESIRGGGLSGRAPNAKLML